MEQIATKAAKNVGDIISLAIRHSREKKMLVVLDRRSPLSRIIADAYLATFPEARFIDFDAAAQQDILDAIAALSAGDLVVLVQSTNFLLAAFRIRIELFQRGIAVVEHVHLERATDERQIGIYVDAIAYDPDYYRRLAAPLKAAIDGAAKLEAFCDGTVLTYEGGMEETKYNIGDYSGMKNVGGTFPIGEVFSEPKDFSKVRGEAMIFAFAGVDHLVQMHRPFKIIVREGMIVSHEGPPAFQQVLDQISTEEKLLVREFGIGLNPAMGKDRVLADITAFERQRGLHLSLGEKHGVYKKPGFNPKKTHYHIDIFVDVARIDADGKTIFSA